MDKPNPLEYLENIKKEAPGVIPTIYKKAEEYGFNKPLVHTRETTGLFWRDQENNLRFNPEKLYETVKKYGPLAPEKIGVEIGVLAGLYYGPGQKIQEQIKSIEQELSETNTPGQYSTPRKKRLERAYLELERWKYSHQVLYAAIREERDPLETIALALFDPDIPPRRYEDYVAVAMPFLKTEAVKKIARKMMELHEQVSKT